MSKEKDQTAIKKHLGKVVREEGNKYCSECGAKNPRWASTNLGIFFCLRCAGIHRNLGVHISKVKSISLDRWDWDQARAMENLGNIKANKMWEATMPSTRKPKENDATYIIENFIRDKYDNKLWYDEKALSKKKHKKKKKKKHKKQIPEPDSSSEEALFDSSSSDSEVVVKKKKKKKDVDKRKLKKLKKKKKDIKIRKPAKDSSSSEFEVNFNSNDTTDEPFNPRFNDSDPPAYEKHVSKKVEKDTISGQLFNMDLIQTNIPDFTNEKTKTSEAPDILNTDTIFNNDQKQVPNVLTPKSDIMVMPPYVAQSMNPKQNMSGYSGSPSGRGQGTQNIMNIYNMGGQKTDPFQGMMGGGGRGQMRPMMRPMMQRPIMQPMMQPMQPMMQPMRPMMQPMMRPSMMQPMFQSSGMPMMAQPRMMQTSVDPLGLGGRTNVQAIVNKQPAYTGKPKASAFDNLNVFDNM